MDQLTTTPLDVTYLDLKILLTALERHTAFLRNAGQYAPQHSPLTGDGFIAECDHVAQLADKVAKALVVAASQRQAALTEQ